MTGQVHFADAAICPQPCLLSAAAICPHPLLSTISTTAATASLLPLLPHSLPCGHPSLCPCPYCHAVCCGPLCSCCHALPLSPAVAHALCPCHHLASCCHCSHPLLPPCHPPHSPTLCPHPLPSFPFLPSPFSSPSSSPPPPFKR